MLLVYILITMVTRDGDFTHMAYPVPVHHYTVAVNPACVGWKSDLRHLNLKILSDKQNQRYCLVDLEQKQLFILDKGFRHVRTRSLALKYPNEIYDLSIDSCGKIIAILSDNLIAEISGSDIRYFHPDHDTHIMLEQHQYELSSYNFTNDLRVEGNETLVFSVPQTLSKPLLYSQPLIAKVKLDHTSNSYRIVNQYGRFPSDYSKQYYIQDLPLFQYVGNRVYSMMNDRPVIYMTEDVKQWQRTIPLVPGSFRRSRAISVDAVRAEPELEDRFLLAYSKIAGFLYDPFRNRFLLIYNQPVKWINDEGFVNQYIESPFAVAVLDEHLSLIRTIRFPPGKYDYCAAKCIPEGLLLRILSNQSLQYEVFQL